MSDPNVYPMPQMPEPAFLELAELMTRERDFPANYAEWQALWARRRREEEQRGYRVIFVDVVPANFVEYCKQITPPLPLSWGALTKYVASVAAGSS